MVIYEVPCIGKEERMRTMAVFFILIMAAGLIFCRPVSYSVPDGETLFKSKCGGCHAGGKDATSIAPVKYASIQWERFFKRNKHKRKKDISGIVSSMELDLIKQYLVDHAADSDRPIAAGLK